nr:hypothetical protein [Tanacetum cinerariifolium]
MLFDNTMESIRRFFPMESEGQAADSKVKEGSSKAGKSLKKSAEEEVGKEKKVKEEIAQKEDVVAKQAEKEIFKKAGGILKRKTSKAREDKDKRQKKQDDPKKLTLMDYVEVVSDSDKEMWDTMTYTGQMEVTRHKFFSKMLNDFDREDLIVLYRLFNEKYASTRPGFNDLMLWGDMKIMFEPDNDDEV